MEQSAAPPTLAAVLGVFLRLGMASFGGGLSNWIHNEVVRKRGWLAEGRFMAGLSLCQVLPRPNAANLALHVGQQLRGWPGAATAFLAVGVLRWPMIPVVLALAPVGIGLAGRMRGPVAPERLLALALVFAPLSLVSLGGASVIAQMQRQSVERYGWLSAGRFLDPFAVFRAALGPCSLVHALVGVRSGGLPRRDGGGGFALPTLLAAAPDGGRLVAAGRRLALRDARWDAAWRQSRSG